MKFNLHEAKVSAISQFQYNDFTPTMVSDNKSNSHLCQAYVCPHPSGGAGVHPFH